MQSFPQVLEPSGIVVLIDSDMIVTGSLDEVYTVVRAGRICAYPDPPETRRRWFPEWHEVQLEPRAPLRRGVCVNRWIRRLLYGPLARFSQPLVERLQARLPG